MPASQWADARDCDFHDIVSKYETPLLRYLQRVANPTDVEDLAQEAFLRLHRQTHSAAKPIENIPAFLFRVAHNLAMDSIVSGDTSGNFNPDANLTRAEFAKMVYIAHSGAGALPVVSSAPFADVSTAYWAAPYIAALKGAGVVQGDGAGNFNPDASISRAEALVMIVRAGLTLATDDGGGWIGDVTDGSDTDKVCSEADVPAATLAFGKSGEAIAEAMERGEIHPDRDPLLTAMTLWTTSHGLASVLLLGSADNDVTLPDNADDLIEDVITVTLKGLREPPAG